MENALSISVLITVIGALVALVNIVTQVLKKVTWNKIPSSLLAVIVSLVLTIAAFFAYAQITGSIPIVWYTIFAAVVVGFMVAYAAMFGFDKLKEVLNSLGSGGKT